MKLPFLFVFISVLSALANAAPPQGLEQTIIVLEGKASSQHPVSILAMVPLNQQQHVTLQICKQLVTALPRSTTLKFSCRTGTSDEISKSSAKGALERQEGHVVAVFHIAEALGHRDDTVAFELLNVTGAPPPGRTMKLCEWIADAASNRPLGDSYPDVTLRSCTAQ